MIRFGTGGWRAVIGDEFIKSNIRLLAVGGVDAKNLGSYLAAGARGAGIGGSLFSRKQIASHDWAAITENAKNLMRIARGEEEA